MSAANIGGRVSKKAAQTIERLGPDLEIERHTFDSFESVLIDSASTFGIDDSSGIAARVIDLARRTVARPRGHRELRLEELDVALAGYEGPLSIRASECASLLRSALDRVVADLDGIKLSEVVSRARVEDLVRQKYVALALVTGPGGCGKTLSLLKALHDSLSSAERLAGALMPGPRPPHQTLSQLVASWRSRNSTETETLEMTLERVRIANDGGARPVLLLALDGIDEFGWRAKADVAEVISHFLRMHQLGIQQEALLLVTCRSREHFDAMVAPQGTGARDRPDIPEVELDEFTDSEFSEVWQRWFGTEPLPELEAREDSYATLDETRGDSTRTLVRALRHPVILGCTRNLSPEHRQQLVAGDADQWRSLLEEYVNWFSSKVSRRHGFAAQTIRGALYAAAKNARTKAIASAKSARSSSSGLAGSVPAPSPAPSAPAKVAKA